MGEGQHGSGRRLDPFYRIHGRGRLRPVIWPGKGPSGRGLAKGEDDKRALAEAERDLARARHRPQLPVVSAPTNRHEGDATETPEPSETETPEATETETPEPKATETQSPEADDQGENEDDQGENQDDQGANNDDQGARDPGPIVFA